MLVNPVQQTPLAYDSARQILTPPAPVDLPPQPQPATSPIQQGDTPQDKFQPRDGGGGNQQSGGTSDSEKAAISEQLRTAWLRLQQLQQEANEALIAGDAGGARVAAQQAAEVAVTIQNLTGSSPGVALGAIEVAAQQISAHDAVEGVPGAIGSSSSSSNGGTSTSGQAGSSGGGSGSSGATGSPASPGTGGASAGSAGGGSTAGDAPGTIIDLARAGLGTAYEVVDTAASLPSHAAPDRATIAGYKQTVLAAIAGVEALAARVLGGGVSLSSGASVIDIRA